MPAVSFPPTFPPLPPPPAHTCPSCLKAGVGCVEHIARRRPAKQKMDGQTHTHTPTKMRDFDKKLDKLSAIVATMAPVSLNPPALPPVTTLPSVSTLPSHVSEQPQHQHQHQHQRTPTPTPQPAKASLFTEPPPAIETSASFWEAINDSLSCLGRLDPVIRSISVIHMQMLLDTYRTMADFFPFVTLPQNLSCRELLQQRPMLMFAVLTVASYDSVLLQLTLSREFRKVVTVKIMNGEKSLDLLQALLVFIAWHHHYMDSQAVSIPMLCQLCIGIAGGLGLDSISTTRPSSSYDDSSERESKRAYLGCYYLVSNIGLAESAKPRGMSYSSTLRAYASDLASAWEKKTDAILPVLLDTCQFMEDVNETFCNHSEQALIARSQVKRLSGKWDSIRSASKMQANEFSKHAEIFVAKSLLTKQPGAVQWIQLAAHTYLYKTAASVELTDRESTPWASGFQLSLRVTCLRSIEQFLDNSTKLASSRYSFLSIVDWLNLVSTMTGLSKLALHSSPMPGWDPTELQIARSFDYFRDQLSSQMPRPQDRQESSEDVFERFRRITAAMKAALMSSPGRSSPGGSTFELATGSGRTVSLLQDLPLPSLNGLINGGGEKLPTPWKTSPPFDVNNNGFPWRFLLGTV